MFPFARLLVLLIPLISLLFLLYLSFPSMTSDPSNRSTNFLFPSSAVISLTNDNSTFFLSRPAAFGPALPRNGLNGELVVLEEGQLACEDVPGWDGNARVVKDGDVEEGTDNVVSVLSVERERVAAGKGHADIETLQQTARIQGRIVLVMRGGCGFLEKVLWTQRRGGVAVIVGDYKREGGGGGLVTMYAKGDTSNVSIPSIFTTYTTAHLLTTLLPKRYHPPDFSLPNPAPPVVPPTEEYESMQDKKKLLGLHWPFYKHLTVSSGAPTTSTKTSTATTTATPVPTAKKEVKVDSSHRPPMSGEWEGVVIVAETKKDGEGADDGDSEKEGLWITLTPASVRESPFFDTLLVLVVSPVVTLTVVYALLLLRSRIRRRRWRAPKSLVDRLPVRTYQATPPPRPAPPPPPPSSPSPSSVTGSTTITTTTNTSSSSSFPARSSLLSASRLTQHGRGGRGNTEAAGGAESRREKRRPRRYQGGSVECVVCLEEYVDGVSKVMKLPCGHEFHAECITPWLTTRRRTCPICKGDVVRGAAADMSQDEEERFVEDVTERTPLVAEDV
ncbi:hypothetical protein RUND412_004646 [Rhizina undulata]